MHSNDTQRFVCQCSVCRDAPIRNVTDFGVFVKVAPGVKGLVHRSELDLPETDRVEDHYQIGDRIDVKVLPSQDGRLKLSQLAAAAALQS